MHPPPGGPRAAAASASGRGNGSRMTAGCSCAHVQRCTGAVPCALGFLSCPYPKSTGVLPPRCGDMCLAPGNVSPVPMWAKGLLDMRRGPGTAASERARLGAAAVRVLIPAPAPAAPSHRNFCYVYVRRACQRRFPSPHEAEIAACQVFRPDGPHGRAAPAGIARVCFACCGFTPTAAPMPFAQRLIIGSKGSSGGWVARGLCFASFTRAIDSAS